METSTSEKPAWPEGCGRRTPFAGPPYRARSGPLSKGRAAELQLGVALRLVMALRLSVALRLLAALRLVVALRPSVALRLLAALRLGVARQLDARLHPSTRNPLHIYIVVSSDE